MLSRLKNHHPHILVVGDLMIDYYLWGRAERISPEAPVQVVGVKKESFTLGGAGNVISNLVDLGAHVSVASVIGDDEDGRLLVRNLQAQGISTSAVIYEPHRTTSKKTRVIASNQQILRFDKESKEEISLESTRTIIEFVQKQIQTYDAIILSDYGKGVVSSGLAQAIIIQANESNKIVLVDPKGIDYAKYTGAFLLTPNKKEASEASGIDIENNTTLLDALTKLKSQYHLQYSMITLSEDGIALLDKQMEIIPTVAREVFDVTGAGDTVIASLAFALSAGFDITEAAQFANYAAAIVVAKIGSATATLDEIDDYLATLHKSETSSHIKSWDEIEALSSRLKANNKKIVFTNGCFDILHAGHVKYLQVAKSFGDVLIVGLNSDESVRRLKGESRPINEESDRAYILTALESVDFVVIFGEETPYELIKLIGPDILVKGGDYAGKVVVGSDIAKEVKLVDFVAGKSTTNVINKSKGIC